MAQNTKSNKNKQSKQQQQQSQQQTSKKGVQEKHSQTKKKSNAEQKKCSCTCKFFLGSFVLLALIAGLISYDTQVNANGVFEKSTVGKYLKAYGALPYAEKAWYTTMGASARGYKWAEKHVPTYAKPFCELICNLYKLSRNAVCNACGVVRDFVNAKLPIAANLLEQYVPGLPKKIENASSAAKDCVVDLWVKTVTFFKTQVLIGKLSPENLAKALNDTQNAALEYYYIFHKKVDVYAKLK